MGLWRNGHNLWILQHKNVDQRTIGKVEQQQPTIFFVLREWQSSVAESSAIPQKFEVLLTSKEKSVVKFRDQIRMYNSVLAFTSLGAKVDKSVTSGIGPYSFRIQGELYHKSDPCVLSKDNVHSLHNCTFMVRRTNVKTAMLLCHRLIQRHWIGC
jgi:hypothetical protein